MGYWQVNDNKRRYFDPVDRRWRSDTSAWIPSRPAITPESPNITCPDYNPLRYFIRIFTWDEVAGQLYASPKYRFSVDMVDGRISPLQKFQLGPDQLSDNPSVEECDAMEDPFKNGNIARFRLDPVWTETDPNWPKENFDSDFTSLLAFYKGEDRIGVVNIPGIGNPETSPANIITDVDPTPYIGDADGFTIEFDSSCFSDASIKEGCNTTVNANYAGPMDAPEKQLVEIQEYRIDTKQWGPGEHDVNDFANHISSPPAIDFDRNFNGQNSSLCNIKLFTKTKNATGCRLRWTYTRLTTGNGGGGGIPTAPAYWFTYNDTRTLTNYSQNQVPGSPFPDAGTIDTNINNAPWINIQKDNLGTVRGEFEIKVELFDPNVPFSAIDTRFARIAFRSDPGTSTRTFLRDGPELSTRLVTLEDNDETAGTDELRVLGGNNSKQEPDGGVQDHTVQTYGNTSWKNMTVFRDELGLVKVHLYLPMWRINNGAWERPYLKVDHSVFDLGTLGATSCTAYSEGTGPGGPINVDWWYNDVDPADIHWWTHTGENADWTTNCTDGFNLIRFEWDLPARNVLGTPSGGVDLQAVHYEIPQGLKINTTPPKDLYESNDLGIASSILFSTASGFEGSLDLFVNRGITTLRFPNHQQHVDDTLFICSQGKVVMLDDQDNEYSLYGNSVGVDAVACQKIPPTYYFGDLESGTIKMRFKKGNGGQGRVVAFKWFSYEP